MNYIEFPNLGWKLPVSPDLVNFTLFGRDFSIKWYGVIIAIGFLLAMIYALKRAKHFGINSDRMIDVVLVSALFAFVGARLYYVLFSSERADYFAHPLSILQVWNGGLAIYGGILFAFVTALWMCRVRKVPTLAMFDLASLGFLIGQGIGRWGNFFNQEAFGSNTSDGFLLGMTGNLIKDNVHHLDYDAAGLVHPTFLYESLWCLLGLLALHLVSKKLYKFKGEIFSLYIMWYGLGRAFIEGLRTDSLMLGTMRVSQLLAILSLLGGGVLFFVFRGMAQELPKDLFAEELVPDGDGADAEGDTQADETPLPSSEEEKPAQAEEAPSSSEEEELAEDKETTPSSEEEPAQDKAAEETVTE